MKHTEQLIGWTVATWQGRVALLALLTAVLWATQVSAKSVTIDAKHFECTATETHGLEARCTQYTWVKGVR